MGSNSDKKGEGGGGVPGGVSRRSFLQGMGLAVGVATVPLGLRESSAASPAASGIGPGPARLKLKINGVTKTVNVEPRLTLNDVLRDELDMTGTKLVCGRGACGACTVMLDGVSVCSCMMLAVDARGKEITTVEGLAAADGSLDPVQEAFIEYDGQQCGFCTPGMVVQARAFLNEHPDPTREDVQHGLSGNICRCGTYDGVIAAVLSAAGKEASTA